jgi:hypothetical protein
MTISKKLPLSNVARWASEVGVDRVFKIEHKGLFYSALTVAVRPTCELFGVVTWKAI